MRVNPYSHDCQATSPNRVSRPKLWLYQATRTRATRNPWYQRETYSPRTGRQDISGCHRPSPHPIWGD